MTLTKSGDRCTSSTRIAVAIAAAEDCPRHEAGIGCVLHLADHDPNGIDMTRCNAQRLELYARRKVEVRRVALNIDQVRRSRRPRTSPRKPAAAMRRMSSSTARSAWMRSARP